MPLITSSSGRPRHTAQRCKKVLSKYKQVLTMQSVVVCWLWGSEVRAERSLAVMSHLRST